jgi:hypothetical protein
MDLVGTRGPIADGRGAGQARAEARVQIWTARRSLAERAVIVLSAHLAYLLAGGFRSNSPSVRVALLLWLLTMTVLAVSAIVAWRAARDAQRRSPRSTDVRVSA